MKKRPGLVRNEGGVDIEQIAVKHGFLSGEALCAEILSAKGKIADTAALADKYLSPGAAKNRRKSPIIVFAPSLRINNNLAVIRALYSEFFHFVVGRIVKTIMAHDVCANVFHDSDLSLGHRDHYIHPGLLLPLSCIWCLCTILSTIKWRKYFLFLP